MMQNQNNGQGPMGRETVAENAKAIPPERLPMGAEQARYTVQTARIHEGAGIYHSRNQVEPKGLCLLPSKGGLTNSNNGQGPMGRETVAPLQQHVPERLPGESPTRDEHTVHPARIHEGAEPMTKASNGSLQGATSSAPTRGHSLMYLNEKDVLYAAGFFDGEGCVQIGASGGSRFTLWIRITNTNLSVLEWLSERLGGAINVQTPPKKKFKKNPKPSWFWRLYSDNASVFLEQIHPHLIVKREQARLAIEFQKRVNSGTNKLTDEELSIRLSYAKRISELNNGATQPITPIFTSSDLPSEDDYLYAAGVLDGEGYILVHAFRTSHWLGVRVTNTNRNLLEKLKRQFGGGIASKEDGRETPCWDWGTTGRGAVAFLGKVLPYLIVKAEVARLGIEFERLKSELLARKSSIEEKMKLGSEYKMRIFELNRRPSAAVPARP